MTEEEKRTQEFLESENLKATDLYRILLPLDKMERFVLLSYMRRHSRCKKLEEVIAEAQDSLKANEVLVNMVRRNNERKGPMAKG